MSSDEPLAGLRFSVLGPGKVGRSLAAWSQAAGARLETMAGREAAGRLVSGGQDFLLLTVPEKALPSAVADLALRPQATVALHTAGSLGAGVLSPLAPASAIGALHPLKAFTGLELDRGAASGVTFGWSGDEAAAGLARRLVTAWGGLWVAVPEDERALYHFAATLAAGGVTTLLAAAAELARSAGLPSEVAQGYFILARGSLELAATAEERERGGAARTITGPVARGDAEAFARGMSALVATAPDKAELLVALAREGLHQLSRSAPLSAAQQQLAASLEAWRPGRP